MADEPFYKDIQLTRRAFNQRTSDRDYVDLISSFNKDVQTVSGRSNLAQAIINRLLTRKGELSKLGHPQYGSRLYLLVGELNNIRLRGLAEIYIREALNQEQRIEEITFVNIEPPSRATRDELIAHIGLKPVGGEDEISLSIPINLGG